MGRYYILFRFVRDIIISMRTDEISNFTSQTSIRYNSVCLKSMLTFLEHNRLKEASAFRSNLPKVMSPKCGFFFQIAIAKISWQERRLALVLEVDTPLVE